MKKYIILFALCLPLTSKAEKRCEVFVEEAKVEEKLEIKTDVPVFLKGATIIVKLANGKEVTMSADKFKIVPRKQQFITTKVRETNVRLCVLEQEQQKEKELNKNRISALIGSAPGSSLNVTKDANSTTIEHGNVTVTGVQYQRLVTDRVSVGGQIQSNESVLVNIGFDF